MRGSACGSARRTAPAERQGRGGGSMRRFGLLLAFVLVVVSLAHAQVQQPPGGLSTAAARARRSRRRDRLPLGSGRRRRDLHDADGRLRAAPPHVSAGPRQSPLVVTRRPPGRIPCALGSRPRERHLRDRCRWLRADPPHRASSPGRGRRVVSHGSADRFLERSRRELRALFDAQRRDRRSIRRLTDHPAEDAHPSWSPDGRYIAFESDRNGPWDIYVMNADGTGVRNITNHPANNGPPRWKGRSR